MSAAAGTPALPEAHYPPLTGEATARERLAREPLPQRLWRKAGTGFRRMECVWLPYYRLTVTLASSTSSGTLEAVVDAHAGCLALVSSDSEATPGPPAAAEHFPPRLPLEAVLKIARRELTAKALSQRGSTKRPHVAGIEAHGILYWPYWVYYFERRAGRLDLRLLDALTGERPGHKLKTGLLDAFLAASADMPARCEEEST